MTTGRVCRRLQKAVPRRLPMAQQHLVVQAAMPPQIPFLLQKILQNLQNMQEKLQETAKKGRRNSSADSRAAALRSRTIRM